MSGSVVTQICGCWDFQKQKQFSRFNRKERSRDHTTRCRTALDEILLTPSCSSLTIGRLVWLMTLTNPVACGTCERYPNRPGSQPQPPPPFLCTRSRPRGFWTRPGPWCSRSPHPHERRRQRHPPSHPRDRRRRWTRRILGERRRERLLAEPMLGSATEARPGLGLLQRPRLHGVAVGSACWSCRWGRLST